jgi:transcriptional regulator with XRE-family HTH domain
MGQLSRERIEYAVARLDCIVTSRGFTQTQLADLSGVSQGTISRMLHPQDDDPYRPTEDVLGKLFEALGVNLLEILNEPDCLPEKIVGYLATPLTGLTDTQHKTLRKVISDLRAIASDRSFDAPPLEIYWPGDHTHPIDHPNLTASQVYVIDRSRASTHDFMILFCAEPSYGVGQENEIATQAGVPAIRLIPQKPISRMILGSFARAIDVQYEGTLQTGIKLPRGDLLKALQDTRRLYFRHRAFYRGGYSEAFGTRLKRLILDRYGGDYLQCADDLGISLDYLHKMMEEPFSVANPGARLLARIAKRLSTTVGYLLGEWEVTDPIYVASNASWRQWADKAAGVDLATGLQIRDKWRSDYHMWARARSEATVTSFRNAPKLMKVEDWDQLYQANMKAKGGRHPIETKLL